jgi:hypothetical protein
VQVDAGGLWIEGLEDRIAASPGDRDLRLPQALPLIILQVAHPGYQHAALGYRAAAGQVVLRHVEVRVRVEPQHGRRLVA